MPNLDYARILTAGVGGWLQFEYACDRSELFSERYLSSAIGQILSSRTGNRTYAEYVHPVLAALAKGAGRRPEVDFVVCDPYPKIAVAVESKWIGRTAPSIQSILWDLIRLELLAHDQKARCFFVLGGKRSSLEKLFMHKDFSGVAAGKMARPLLRHDNNLVHKTNLVPTAGARIPLLKQLFEPYQNMKFPHKILTRRSAPFPADQPGRIYQVYVWEVLSVANREIFLPRNSKHYSVSGKSRRDFYRVKAAQ